MAVSPAVADDCDHSVHGTVGRGTTTELDEVVGNAAYNDTGSSITMHVAVGSSHSWGETKTVTLGGEAGFNWGVFSTKLSATYGSASIVGASVTTTTSLDIPVPSHFTGWVSVEPYRNYYWWKGTTERWNAQESRCVTFQVNGAQWGDAERLLVAHTHAGKYHPKAAKR